MTITLKVSENTKKEMIEFFEEFKREKTPPYAVFQADDADCVVTLYESGKAVFQGVSADISAKMWVEREKHLNPLKQVETTNSDKKEKKDKKNNFVDPKIYNSSSIGSDEVGTGDYFGPIVVTAAYVNNVKKQLADGSLKVFDTSKFTVTVVPPSGAEGDFGVNTNAKVDANGHLTSYLADVDDFGD